ncbi:MAG: ABC transporter substrate-binding protein [Trueperaceae bacterium]
MKKLLLLIGALLITSSLAQTEISLATWETGDGAERLKQIADGFMAENPDVKVNIEKVTGSDDPSILVRMASGTAPDIIQTGDFSVRRLALASEGGYLDLAPLIEADPEFNRDNYFPEVFDVGVVDGSIYALGKDFHTTAFYVNTKMFEEAGIEVPAEWTYDDLVEIAQELTLDANGNNALSPDFDPENIVQYGWWHDTNWVRGWQSVPYAYGAEFLSEDGKTATGYLNSEEIATALKLYQDSVHTYHISPSVAAIEAQPGVNLFQSSQAAIQGPTGSWNITPYSENPEISFATVPMPSGPAKQASVICWSGFGVSKDSKHPQEAYEFVKYFSTKGQEIMVELGLTADKALSDKTGRASDPLWSPFVQGIDTLQPLDDFKTAHWVECINMPVSNLLQSIQSPDGADVDIQAELDAMATEADTCLAQPF